MVRDSATIMLNQYFKRRRALVEVFLAMGNGVGILLTSPVIFSLLRYAVGVSLYFLSPSLYPWKFVGNMCSHCNFNTHKIGPTHTITTFSFVFRFIIFLKKWYIKGLTGMCLFLPFWRLYNWRIGLQCVAALMVSVTICALFYRSATLYHPQRRAILHLKSQKRSTLSAGKSLQGVSNLWLVMTNDG